MKTKTVKGMNDYLPREADIRDRLSAVIIDTYKNAGFEHIVTPIVEDAENLDKSEGGDNLNLIFKVMKRGEKLTKALEAVKAGESVNALSDMGLRYDLTLPLCRFFANNRDKLSLPFKAIQTDRVYRAENSQRGRLREFVQCDIDIIGSAAKESEIELILTTARALRAIGIGNFTVKINDRALLRKVITALGFRNEDFESVCISFDKLDKIGAEGVLAELTEKGFDGGAIKAFGDFFSKDDITLAGVKELIGDCDEIAGICAIMDSVKEISDGAVPLAFDLSLVRGQGYYTGTVFEIVSGDFSGAIAGGGRYDKLIGKFIGEEIPAVGFSIGFERIFSILMEKGAENLASKKKAVILYSPDNFVGAAKYADAVRGDYDVALCEAGKKPGKQLQKYAERGYGYFMIFGRDEELKELS